jgi:mono/diheme cytochrome c family protein
MRPNLTALLAFAILGSLGGCWDDEPAAYPLGPELAKITDEPARNKAVAFLERTFGTPEEPHVPRGCGIELARVLQGKTLYRGLCLECHGEFGDGAGPGSTNMDPLPRDFRRGIFKFTSTAGNSKPTRADLVGTLRRGMPLAKMPSFNALEEEKLDWLVEYVVFLAARGETERKLAAMADNDGDIDEAGAASLVASTVASWNDAQGACVTPAAPMPELSPATIAKGKELFHAEAVKCAGCHGNDGKGNGPSATDLKDDWGHAISPRDLTLGVYRHGSRPLDIYLTICCGVKGTPMPSFNGNLSSEDIWALAMYVRSLGAPKSPVW